MGKAEHSLENSDGDISSFEDFDHNDDADNDADSDLFEDPDEEGDGEFEELSEEEHSRLLDDTSAVRETVTKVCISLLSMFISISLTQAMCFLGQLRQLSFAIIHSTTIALPAWRRFCQVHGLTPKLIPRDVVTRWNSTHDMMVFALKYRRPIDSITADKSMKLRKYELDNEGWIIVEQLVAVLQVSTTVHSV
jgi:hypothetical protein